jgi:hypothetical protein
MLPIVHCLSSTIISHNAENIFKFDIGHSKQTPHKETPFEIDRRIENRDKKYGGGIFQH